MSGGVDGQVLACVQEANAFHTVDVLERFGVRKRSARVREHGCGHVDVWEL
jgi:hypothetical protein